MWSYLTLVLLISLLCGNARAAGEVLTVDLEGIIGPATADIYTHAIQQAEADHAAALVVRMDTPGGLDTSMRVMIKATLAAEVPVIVFVAPEGARAASAGVFILYGAHVAAMSPGTNLGAAHPVAIGPGGASKPDETLMKKATNDAVAYIQSLAALRGRNIEWAEQAVRESVSLTASDAAALGVVDLVADGLPALLPAVDGRTVQVQGGEWVLATANAPVRELLVPWHKQLLVMLANPNLAYVLMMLGMYGLIYELANPGLILPGVVGAICLILALYAFSALPTSYAGIALILLAAVMLVSEFFVSGFGLLAAGGVVALMLGSMMLIDTDIPFLAISWKVIIPVSLFTAAFAVLAGVMAVQAHRHKVVSGIDGMIGLELNLEHLLDLEGTVHLEGEDWHTRADERLEAGTRVVVTALDGLTLLVSRAVSKDK